MFKKQSSKVNVQIGMWFLIDGAPVGVGVRQGDTISPKLFKLVPEEIFKNMDWIDQERKIDGSYLNYLRFASDFIYSSTGKTELKMMTKIKRILKYIRSNNKIKIVSWVNRHIVPNRQSQYRKYGSLHVPNLRKGT